MDQFVLWPGLQQLWLKTEVHRISKLFVHATPKQETFFSFEKSWFTPFFSYLAKKRKKNTHKKDGPLAWISCAWTYRCVWVLVSRCLGVRETRCTGADSRGHSARGSVCLGMKSGSSVDSLHRLQCVLSLPECRRRDPRHPGVPHPCHRHLPKTRMYTMTCSVHAVFSVVDLSSNTDAALLSLAFPVLILVLHKLQAEYHHHIRPERLCAILVWAEQKEMNKWKHNGDKN